MSSSAGRPGMWSFRSQSLLDRQQRAALGQPVERLAQVLADGALHLVRARHQRVQRAVFLQQLHGRLGADLVDAGHVVHRVAHQGLVVDHQARRHAELGLDAGDVALAVVHGVDHGDVFVDELAQVLVAAGDHGLDAALGRHARTACRSRRRPRRRARAAPSSPAAAPPRGSASICARRSGGIGERVALYSGYRSSRKVGPGASNTQAT